MMKRVYCRYYGYTDGSGRPYGLVIKCLGRKEIENRKQIYGKVYKILKQEIKDEQNKQQD